MNEDGTELSIPEVLALLEGSRATAFEMAELTEDLEHKAMFVSIAGLANVLAEVIKRLAEIGEPLDD